MTRWDRLKTQDITAWAELTNLLAEVDRTGEFYQPEDLAEELEEADFDPTRDSWALWEGDQLVGYGQLRLRLSNDGEALAHLGGGIHPDYRGRGLGSALMDQMEQRATQASAARYPGAPQLWRAPGNLEGDPVRAMLTHRGYQPIRYWNEMKRLLPGSGASVSVTEPTPPEVDADLVSPTDEHLEATRVAHNLAFQDHWGASPSPQDRWAQQWQARASRPEVSTVALGPDGTVLAYVLVKEWVAKEAYVELVGTVPAARGRGLALAALLRTVALAERDFTEVVLDVDSASPTGATRLYEKAGFTLTKTTASYQREAVQSG